MEYEDVVVCGDFNFNILLEDSLTNYMLSLGLVCIHTSTSSTLVDLIFVTNDLRTCIICLPLICSSLFWSKIYGLYLIRLFQSYLKGSLIGRNPELRTLSNVLLI